MRAACHGRAGRGEESLPARMVGVETGAPGRCRPLQKGEPSHQTRPQPKETTVRKRRWRTEDDRDSSRGSSAHRRRVGDGRASHPAEATCGADVQRSQDSVLGGILWVARTGSSWREMPEEFGKWETAYRRYELWLKQGLWQRILAALGEEALPGPATKEC